MKCFSMFCLSLLANVALAQDLAVRGDRIYVGNGDVITNGVVLIRDGKIRRVGPANRVNIPRGVETLEAAVVTPGLVDAHSVVGLAGYFNQDSDQDQIENSEAIQPELRAIDAYNPRETLVQWLLSHGITTVHTGHAPGEIISGQTLVAKTSGNTIAESVVAPAAMVAATLGDGAVVRSAGRKTPGNRSKAIAMLRAELIKAADYVAKLDAAKDDDETDPPARDLRMESLASVIRKETPLLVTVNRHNDILTALRVAEEFDIRIVLDSAAEAYLVLDDIRAAGVPVILHPLMARAYGDRENMSFTTPVKLKEAGIVFAFQSGYESYVPKTRVVLFEAAESVKYGLPFADALAAITLDAARVIGMDTSIGSIEPGKDGDLALFDGDPFEYTTHSLATVVRGVVADRTRR